MTAKEFALLNDHLEKMDKKIDDLSRQSSEVRTVLLGINGDKGLVGKVEDVCNGHDALSKHFWILVAFLVGSGVLGTGIWAMLS